MVPFRPSRISGILITARFLPPSTSTLDLKRDDFPLQAQPFPRRSSWVFTVRCPFFPSFPFSPPVTSRSVKKGRRPFFLTPLPSPPGLSTPCPPPFCHPRTSSDVVKSNGQLNFRRNKENSVATSFTGSPAGPPPLLSKTHAFRFSDSHLDSLFLFTRGSLSCSSFQELRTPCKHLQSPPVRRFDKPVLSY